MKSERIGNDIKIEWSILRQGVPFSLTDKDVTIYLGSPFGRTKISGFSIDSNKVLWTFFGKDQKSLGKYSLILVVNEGNEGMITTDICDFVNLVDCSCKVGGADDAGVQTETISLTSNLEYVATDAYDDTAVWEYINKLEKNKANKTEIPTKVSQLENDAEYATKSEIDGKQDEIKDLDAIRSGAAKGATALQSIPAEYVTDDELDNALKNKVNVNQIATINGKSLVNGGNIVIQGGEGGGYDDTEIRAELDELSTEIQQVSERVDNLPQGASMTPILYADLVNLRDNGSLVAGSFYRITDYITTTVQENTHSANHPFDVIVLALSENTLAEEAYAFQSARDTDGYFANSNLSAWKIWYCLDNDAERFAWADVENGKGVIYRMIDEFENDIPYDFKNIQFRRKISLDEGYPQFSEEAEETWVYTFCANSYHINNDEWSELKDGSLESPYGHMSDENSLTFHHNSMKPWFMSYNGNDIYQECGKAYLNDNVFLGYWEEIGSGNEEEMPYYYAYCCFGNTFGNGCYSNSFGNNCGSNSFGNGCYSNSFGNGCYSNSFGNYCNYNSFGNGCYSNSFGNNCGSNSFGNNCNYNSFGNNCNSNSFKDQDGIADNASYNKLDDGVNNIELWYDDNNGNYGELKNHHVCRGCKERQIEIYENRDFETTYAMTSDGQFREYCIADVV